MLESGACGVFITRLDADRVQTQQHPAHVLKLPATLTLMPDRYNKIISRAVHKPHTSIPIAAIQALQHAVSDTLCTQSTGTAGPVLLPAACVLTEQQPQPTRFSSAGGICVTLYNKHAAVDAVKPQQQTIEGPLVCDTQVTPLSERATTLLYTCQAPEQTRLTTLHHRYPCCCCRCEDSQGTHSMHKNSAVAAVLPGALQPVYSTPSLLITDANKSCALART